MISVPLLGMKIHTYGYMRDSSMLVWSCFNYRLLVDLRILVPHLECLWRLTSKFYTPYLLEVEVSYYIGYVIDTL